MRDLDLLNVTAAVYGEPWAILPDKLAVLADVLSRRRAGLSVTAGDLDKLKQEADERNKREFQGATIREVRGVAIRQVASVAVVPMFGTVTHRPNLFSRYSGGVSAEQFAAVNEELADDSTVTAIVWDVDSPGGSVAGVPEAADRLFALRGKKKIVAVSNTLNASAAYWLSSAADEISVTPSSLTGSIGVYTVHEDRSGANERGGYRVTYIYAGKRKIDGNPDAPLTDEAAAAMQRVVDDYYGLFVRAVARQRKATESAVREGFGEGEVLTAGRAVEARLADRVETMPQVLARLGVRSGGQSSGLAEAVQRAVALKA